MAASCAIRRGILRLMNILVDGHNLIGQMPGISLADADDEAQLVAYLRRYAMANRHRSVIVVFDGGVYGHPQQLNGYGVICFFARSPQDADTQIIKRVAEITRPSDWRVVTSDRVVARAATDRRITVISSHDFARELTAVPTPKRSTPGDKPDHVRLSPAELNEWLLLFGEPAEELPPAPTPPTAPAEQAETASWKRRGRSKRVRKK